MTITGRDWRLEERSVGKNLEIQEILKNNFIWKYKNYTVLFRLRSPCKKTPCFLLRSDYVEVPQRNSEDVGME